MDNIKYGFSTGALHKSLTVKESLTYLKKLNFSVVELGFGPKERILDGGQFDEISAADLESFSFISLHAPRLEYGKDKDTAEVLKRIEALHAQRPLDLVIFHPDEVKDFKLLDEASFPVGIENMDNKKKSFKTAEELAELLDKYKNFKAVIDVNHIFTNDSSMKLLDDFYDQLGGRIAELHVSGFEKFHEPFIQTKQENIIRAIKDKSVVMIDEGDITPDLLAEERDYFLKIISS